MDYQYIVGIIGDYPVPALITFYFLFILLFGETRVKISAFIIFISSALILLTASYDFSVLGYYLDTDEYVAGCKISILWDGVVVLILSKFLLKDSDAWKQWLLLAFATLCHCMITLYLSTESSEVKEYTIFFYTWYDELIIIVGILQMAASYNGMVNGVINLSRKRLRALFWIHGYCSRVIQSFSIYYRKTKKSEKRT